MWITFHHAWSIAKVFQGLNSVKKPTDNSGNIPTHGRGHPQTTIIDPQCEVCLFWIDKYYTDIPTLQLQIKTLTTQINSLKDENHRLKSTVQRQGKCLKRTRNIIVKNVESVTTVVNSEILWIKFSMQLRGKYLIDFLSCIFFFNYIDLIWFLLLK